MDKYKIKEIKKFGVFVLSNERDENTELTMEFYDCQSPEVGDTLIFNESPNKKEMYAFGSLESSYGKVIKEETDDLLVYLVKKDKKFMLKRLYG